tara:strand:- start:1763 stop:2680 length:918 start_codon:yes stop_codon:yes gene_type:complete
MIRTAFENAIVTLTVLGGSTNAVLHLLAMAHACDVKLSLDDFQYISDNTPYLSDLKPSGQYVMEDLHSIGGIPGVMKYLLENHLLHGDCMTVTGNTIRENLEKVSHLKKNQKIFKTLTNPIKPTGHIQILRGNLAPEGAVAKITGKEGDIFKGTAIVFDREEDMLLALEKNNIKKGHVIVIRYEGPKGGPGMPEMLTPTSAIMGSGLGQDVALITDGRFSGGSHGFIVGHITPEAQDGGPIALLRDGDNIIISGTENKIDVLLSQEELSDRLSQWHEPKYKSTSGTLYKYIKTVSSASSGCVTDQ